MQYDDPHKNDMTDMNEGNADISSESDGREPTAGEVNLFFRLYLPEADTVGNFIASKVGPSHAEDVLHNAICAGIRNIYHLENRENDFVKWFYGVIGKTIALHWRDKATENRVTLNYLEQTKQVEQESIMSDNPEKALLNEERSRMAYEALGSLPEELRTAFSLREGEGLSYREIAERTGVHVNTVKDRVIKAKRLLSARMQQMVIVGIMSFVHSDHLRAAPARALQDILATTNIPPEAIQVAGLTTTGVIGAAGAVPASGGAGASGTAGAFSLYGILLAFGSFFFWMMSVLIGAQVYGAAMIRSAPTLPVRRWLIKHLLFAYSALIVAITMFMAPLLVNACDDDFLAPFYRVFKWCLILSILGYLVWFRQRYTRMPDIIEQKALDSDSLETDRRFIVLQRIVYAGFLFTSVLIAGGILGGILAIIPEVRLALSVQKTILAFTIIFLHVFVFLVIGLFHLGTFYLFRRCLKISKNEMIFQETADALQVRNSNVRTRPETIGLLVAVVLTLGPGIMHLILLRTRILFAVTECITIGLLWFGLIQWNKRKPKGRGLRIILMLGLQLLAVFLLRIYLWK